MALADTIPKLLQTAAKMKTGGSGNEANTKALLIEPMLAALGWNPADLDSVVREVKVFDGTFLDYALKLHGKACVYVEAKGLNENLDDKKFISQAVNYANNDGVAWCVLTNGWRVRVYKSNESVPADRKLLFEVDLTDDSETPADKAQQLRLISRDAVEAGDLDRFGERVFTEKRVRKALAELASSPPKPWLDAVSAKLGTPEVSIDALKRSLARILDAPPPPGPIPSGKGKVSPPGPPTPPKGQEYGLDHHLANKSAPYHGVL